jgi:hypothetical protein
MFAGGRGRGWMFGACWGWAVEIEFIKTFGPCHASESVLPRGTQRPLMMQMYSIFYYNYSCKPTRTLF